MISFRNQPHHIWYFKSFPEYFPPFLCSWSSSSITAASARPPSAPKSAPRSCCVASPPSPHVPAPGRLLSAGSSHSWRCSQEPSFAGNTFQAPTSTAASQPFLSKGANGPAGERHQFQGRFSHCSTPLSRLTWQWVQCLSSSQSCFIPVTHKGKCPLCPIPTCSYWPAP